MKALAWTKEFTRGDKIIYAVTIGWDIFWYLILLSDNI